MNHELDSAVAAIRGIAPRRVAVLTGAGVSAESGIPTFRDAGGLWRHYRPEDLATPEAFDRDPATVWQWYEMRRSLIREARPNAAHEAIASLGADTLVVTQNVDGLHGRAGSRNVIELHGNIFRVRCTAERRVLTADLPYDAVPPYCACGALLRPDVIWFGEMLAPDDLARAAEGIRAADLLLVVGTSGVVYPAAGLVSQHRALSIEINPQASGVTSACTLAVPMKATEAVPLLVAAFLESRK
ncbi:MAG: NAD-dependent deacylase [Acidobacteriota bacterium]